MVPSLTPYDLPFPKMGVLVHTSDVAFRQITLVLVIYTDVNLLYTL